MQEENKVVVQGNGVKVHRPGQEPKVLRVMANPVKAEPVPESLPVNLDKPIREAGSSSLIFKSTEPEPVPGKPIREAGTSSLIWHDDDPKPIVSEKVKGFVLGKKPEQPVELGSPQGYAGVSSLPKKTKPNKESLRLPQKM